MIIKVCGMTQPANIAEVAEAGADILVAGSAVFKASDPAAAVAAMR